MNVIRPALLAQTSLVFDLYEFHFNALPTQDLGAAYSRLSSGSKSAMKPGVYTSNSRNADDQTVCRLFNTETFFYKLPSSGLLVANRDSDCS
jgi:hypothetical protein